MTQGIDRVKQLFEVRAPKSPAVIAPFDGTISFYETGKMRYVKIISEYQKKTYMIKAGYTLDTRKNQLLAKGAIYASKGKSKLKIKEEGKVLETHKDRIVLGVQEIYTRALMGLTALKTKDGTEVFK
jgi:hypothetical protein